MKNLNPLITFVSLFFFTLSCSSWRASTFGSISKQRVIEKEGVKIYKDLRYADKPKDIEQDSTSDRILDLYKPIRNTNDKLPIFVMIHGGGFRGGDKASKGNEELCLKIASQGFAVISINYYLTLKYEENSGASCTANMSKGVNKSGFNPKLQEAIRNASDDAQLALKWIKNKSNQFKLDKNSVVISGGSAGAMTALYTAYVSNQQVLPIKGVVNFWGGLENSNLIKKKAPPLLTFHGDQDKLINVDYAYDLEIR